MTPPPGSPEAIKVGCKCPRLDNCHGRGYLGGAKDGSGRTVFVYTAGCPLHSPSEKESAQCQ